MGKRLQIILLTLLFAAALLYGGHLVSVSQEKTQVYDALAQQPIQAVQAISPENLQFAVKSRYFDGSGYVDCVLTSPERTPFYPADTVVGAADEQMMKAVRTVVSSLGIYDYDWSSERPAVAPGKSSVTLSFFQGGGNDGKSRLHHRRQYALLASGGKRRLAGVPVHRRPGGTGNPRQRTL